MDVLKFPIAKVSICFVAGILFSVYLPIERIPIILFTAISLIAFIVTYFLSLKKTHSLTFATAFIATSFCLGMLTHEMHDVRHDKLHFLEQSTALAASDELEVALLQRLKPTAYSERYIAKVQKVNGKIASGKILVNFYKDSSATKLSIGTVFKTNTKLNLHRPPLNPDSFDYGKYLATKGIHAQISINIKSLVLRDQPNKNLRYYADNIRQRIINNLSANGFPQSEIPIISALFLGQQQDISAAVLRDYQLAGAVHILSVSGLHVGFILVFINFILKPLPKTRNANLLRLFTTIILLWTFAILAGLSPSVVRSVTMFSFVAWGMLLRRKTNIYYILLLSAFAILLIEPAFLFDVGFQLSYTTLFFIIWLQPKIRRILDPKNIVLKYLNDILSVSVAAQIGAFPLSIYYFHQFPGLFFVTNLLIIPALSLIMILGIIVLLMAAFNYVPFYPMKLLSESVKMINQIINKIATQEQFIISNISFNKYLLLTSYLLIITTILFIYKKNYPRTMAMLLAIVGVQTASIINKQNSQSTTEFIIFHQNKHSLLSVRNGQNATFFTSDSLNRKISEERAVKDYLVSNFIKQPSIKPLENAYTFSGKRIVIIDSLAVYPKELDVDILLMTKSAKVNFERMLLDLRPKTVVADGSNYKYLLEKWEQTALKQKIPFHKTSEEGFFRVK